LFVFKKKIMDEPFENITIAQISDSKSNTKINERIQRYYNIFHYAIRKKVLNSPHKEDVFKKIINAYKSSILKQCTYSYFNSYRIGGGNAREYFLDPFTEGIDVLEIFKKNELSIKLKIEKDKLRMVYGGSIPKQQLKKYYEFKDSLINKIENGKVNEKEEELFFFKYFLNNFCKGIALRIIVRHSYNDIINPYVPFFNNKIINRGINLDIIDGLVEIGAIEKQNNTIFLENIENTLSNRIVWNLKPFYTIYYFLNSVSISAINSYYINKKKLDYSKLIEHFENISMNTIYTARRNRTKGVLAKDIVKQNEKVKLEQIAKKAFTK